MGISTSGRWSTHAFGVVSQDSGVRDALKELCVSLSDRTGVILYPQLVRSYDTLQAQVEAGALHFAWAPPVVAAQLGRRGATIAMSLRRSGHYYHAVLFALKERGFRTIEKLRDTTVAWVDRASAAGYIVPYRWLQDQGVDPETHFRSQRFAGTHDDVVRAVLSGAADAGASYAQLDSGTRRVADAAWLHHEEGPRRIEVVALAGSVPSDAIVAAQKVDAEVIEELMRALTTLAGAELELARKVFHTAQFDRASRGYTEALNKLLGGAE